MGGVVNTVSNAAQSVASAAVDTVKDVVSTVVEHPLEGVAKIVEAPIALTLNEGAALAPATSKIPIVGDVTKGAGAASRSLSSLERGQLPDRGDIRDTAIAGAALGGVLVGGGITGAFAGDSLGKAAFNGSLGLGDFLGAAGGAFGEDGFDFGAFLGGIPTNKPTAPTRSTASGGGGGGGKKTAEPNYFPGEDSGMDLTTIALLVAAAFGSFLILR